jgi:hypothetical protein
MFGQRPSRMLGLQDDTVALDLDLAACEHILRLETEAARRAAEEMKRRSRVR